MQIIDVAMKVKFIKQYLEIHYI